MSGMDRRSFFKIVATTGAAAAAGGCGQSAEQLIPYVIPPDNIVPGVPAYFASVCRECPSGCGVIAKNRDGRVIKLEGNPDHPSNTGALCVLGHAGLQALYHPDRFRGPSSGGKPVAWADAEKQLADKLGALAKGKQGARIAVVSGLETGSLARLMDEWVQAARRADAHRLRAARLRGPARLEPGRLRPRRDPRLRDRGGHLPGLLRRGLPRDVAQQRGLHRRLRADARLLPGQAGHVRARRAAHVADRGQRGRVAAQRARHRGGARPRDAQGDRGRGPAGARAPTSPRCARRSAPPTWRRPRPPRASPRRRSSTSPATSPRRRPASCWAAAWPRPRPTSTETLVAVNLLNAAIGAVGTRVRFGSASPFSRVSPYSDMVALTQAMAAGADRGAGAGRRQSGLRDAAQVGLRGGPGQGPARGLAREPAQRDHRAGAPGAADAARARGLGRLRVRGRRARAHAAHDGSRADRRQAGGRQGHRRRLPERRPAGARDSRPGKGPLKWASFEDFVKEEWQKVAQGLRQAPDRSAEFWEAALRRGGVWRTGAGPGGLAPARGRAHPGRRPEARGRRLPRADRLSLQPLLRRPGRRPAVAARGAGHDHPGRVGLAGSRFPPRPPSRWGSRAAISSR